MNGTYKVKFDILRIAILDPPRMMLETMRHVTKLVGDDRFAEAVGYLFEICDLCNLMEKLTETYVTQEMLPIFETEARFSYSLKDIEEKRDDVSSWLAETSQMTKKLQDMITENGKGAFPLLNELIKMIGADQRFSEFKNTINAIIMEFGLYEAKQPKNALFLIFGKLNLHPTIRRSSEGLFKDGHYAQAILEACKTLIAQVKEKSGLKTMKDSDLMGKVFDVEYNREPLKITKPPLIKLNDLSTLEEIDEQRGFMHLFMGTVIGIRNPKAHAIVEQRDPFRTLEYLSLISLLAKRVDEGRITPAS